ncbi:sulfatase family protein [Maribacter sp. 2307ULW6-5]|uniref:sulfatase family protein n=1 Tax=Maribacter sp. 2307ULW6-5 TaxID=3386275 RepID=UPI0039BD7B18
MTRASYRFPLLLACLLGLLSCKEEGRSDEVIEPNPPNIIYILADDLGYGDVSCYHPSGKIKTPHLDALAAQGMRFTDAHSPSAVCTPTRYGILTGRYSWRSPLKSGVLTGKSKALIAKNRTTVASLLKKSGYHTAFIGKWHLGWDWALKDTADLGGDGWNPGDFDAIDFTKNIAHSPNDLGFDLAYGHSGSLDMAPYVYVENGKVTAQVKGVTEDTGKYTWWRKGPTAADFLHRDVTPNFFRRSMAYVKERSKVDAPFFLYLALPSPHTPILPTADWLGKSGMNPYADFMMEMDHYVGQLVATVQEMGIADNTMVVFTSDNGCSPEADFEVLEQFGHDPNGGFRGHKADIFEGGHRVPFIVKWPARVAAGSRSDATVCLTDLMATAAHLVQVPLADDEGEDSFSLLPLLAPQEGGEYARTATVHHSINGSFALRKGDYKLIFAPDSGGWSPPVPGKDMAAKLPPLQLYHLKNDPGETENLVAGHPDILEELTQLMQGYIANGRSTPGPVQQNAPLGLNGQPWHQMEHLMGL